MTSQRGSRVRIPPSPLKAEAVISLGFSRRRRDHPFSFFSSAESNSSVVPLRRWWSQVLPLGALHRYPPLLQHVPICTGGFQASSQSSYAQGNPLQVCSDPRRRTADAPALLLCRSYSLSQWILLQACSTRSGGAGSPPKTSGGSQTSSQPSYAQGNPLQACFGSHRRNVGALALLLFRPYLSVDPPPSVFDPFRGCRKPP